MIRGQSGAIIGWVEKGRVGSTVGMEVDLRSEDTEERTIRFIVDGKIQKCSVARLGRAIKFGVCLPSTSFYSALCLIDSLIS